MNSERSGPAPSKMSPPVVLWFPFVSAPLYVVNQPAASATTMSPLDPVVPGMRPMRLPRPVSHSLLVMTGRCISPRHTKIVSAAVSALFGNSVRATSQRRTASTAPKPAPLLNCLQERVDVIDLGTISSHSGCGGALPAAEFVRAEDWRFARQTSPKSVTAAPAKNWLLPHRPDIEVQK